MTTLNSLFEKKTYTDAAGGCAKGILIMILFGVIAPIMFGLIVMLSRGEGKSVCPHCGRALSIQKGN